MQREFNRNAGQKFQRRDGFKKVCAPAMTSAPAAANSHVGAWRR
jgi:hypothetical protein